MIDTLKERAAILAPFFVCMHQKLSNIARHHGYALAVHGSMERDLDLIAVPWIFEASSPEELVEAVRKTVGGWIVNDNAADPFDYTRRNPSPKPHGRLVWAIQLGGGSYIDLSVMPRRSQCKGPASNT